MIFPRFQIILLLAISQFTANQCTPIVDYIVSVIRTHTSHNAAPFLMIDLFDRQERNGTFYQVLHSKPMATLSRIVLIDDTAFDPYLFSRSPSLIVLNLEKSLPKRTRNFWRFTEFLNNTNTLTKVFVITDSYDGSFFRDTGVWVKMKLQLMNSVFLATDKSRLYFYSTRSDSMQEIPFLPANQLFADRLDMIGYGVYITAKHDKPTAYWRDGSLQGSDVQWIQETCRLMNASLIVDRHNCPRTAEIMSPCYRSFLYDNKNTVGLAGYVVRDDLFNYVSWQQDVPRPGATVLIVPTEKKTTINGAVARLFRFEAWVVTLVLVILVEVAFLLSCLPSAFSEDPLMYATIGPVDQSLARIGIPQNFFLIAFLIIVQVIAIAFLTKLVSFIMVKPSETLAVNTLSDLQRTNIRIKVDLLEHPDLQYHPIVKERRSKYDSNNPKLDDRSAYAVDREQAEYILQLKDNFDESTDEPLYRMVVGTLETNVRWHYFRIRTYCKRTLLFTQRALFESGIWIHWNEKHRKLFSRGRYIPIVQSSKLIVVRKLDLDDLKWAWRVLTVGLALSLFNFAFELLIIWFYRY